MGSRPNATKARTLLSKLFKSPLLRALHGLEWVIFGIFRCSVLNVRTDGRINESRDAGLSTGAGLRPSHAGRRGPVGNPCSKRASFRGSSTFGVDSKTRQKRVVRPRVPGPVSLPGRLGGRLSRLPEGPVKGGLSAPP